MRLFILFLLLVFSTSLFHSCQYLSSKRVLVFSHTKGYRHASIEKGHAAIQKIGKEKGWHITISENPGIFTDDSLKQFDVILFLSTTGDILNAKQEAAFMRYIQAGGGWVGVHAAADTEYGWIWYGQLAGAYFDSHPAQANATIQVTCDGHDFCKSLPAKWSRWDEWYNFRDVQADIHVVASLDESTYNGGNMGAKHPITWYHEFDGGRAFYTGLGHTDSSYVEKEFLGLLSGGIQWASEHDRLDYTKAYTIDPPEENRMEKQLLANNLDEPMEFEVMANDDVLFCERKGDLKLYNHTTKLIETIAHIDVHSMHEDGLLGIALDPNFETNHFLYTFYSPNIPESIQRISRFELKNKELDKSSEKIVLTIPVQRQECCHSAGYLQFGKDGLLYASIGDNTNPFASDGFDPIDERPGRMPWDAQKSSANSNDLRGKIIRIKVKPDATYDIPDGNLFKPGTPKTRPEIFVMGCRNPFRFSVDARRKLVHWGDVGPDAGKDSIGRGPKGYDFFGQAGMGGGFFGWPYIRGNGHAYNDYDFETKKSGPKFDPNHIINNSPNNTGLAELPPYKAPQVWYSYDQSREFPWVATGGKNPMAGPMYYQDEYPANPNRFSNYFDGKLFIYEWMRRWIFVTTLDKQNRFVKFDPFMPNSVFANPMDMKFGPDGSLYILSYGTKWFARNEDATLYKINFNAGNRAPLADFKADRYNGATPLTVKVDARTSSDADHDQLNYIWSIDGKPAANGDTALLVLNNPGIYDVSLTVTDKEGASNTVNTKIQAGNELPEVKVDVFGNKTFFWPGRKIPYSISIKDKEDGDSETGNLDPKNVNVSAAFVQEGKDLAKLTAEGHLAGMKQSPFESGRLLIDKSDCKTCHGIDKAINGPAYMEVSKRYSGKPGIEKTLAQKVMVGGSGNWGERAMAAHPQLSEGEVLQMVRYILSLSGNNSNDNNASSLSSLLSGIAEVKESGDGNYVISASYTDKGSNGIPSLTNQVNLSLRSSQLTVDQMDAKSKGVSSVSNNNQTYWLLKNNDWVAVKNIDYKDLKGVEITAGATTDGKIELYTDDPLKGSKVSEVSVLGSDLQKSPKLTKLYAELKLIKGNHDLYFVFKSKDPNDASSICVPGLFEFKFNDIK